VLAAGLGPLAGLAKVLFGGLRRPSRRGGPSPPPGVAVLASQQFGAGTRRVRLQASGRCGSAVRTGGDPGRYRGTARPPARRHAHGRRPQRR
jgi:hypothetical protein